MPAHRADTAVLITMSHSHYAEKARWALDWIGLPYREAAHIPLLHRVSTSRRGGGSVPVLLHGEIRLFDSTDILAHADQARGGDRLYPREARLRLAVEALEERFDTVLGPHSRRWAYAQVLPETRLLCQMMSRGVPRYEAALLPLIMPFIVPLIRRAFRVTPDSAERSLQRIGDVFAEVDERLRDGRPFLVGDRFTAADLTFAALASPVLLPPGCGAAYPDVGDVPTAMREQVLRLRDSAAGQFGLRLYREERAGSNTISPHFLIVSSS